MSIHMKIIATTKTWDLSFPYTQTLQNIPPRIYVKPLNCTPVQQQQQQQQQQQVDSGIMCEACSGRGWIVCDFCKGQKTNVRADNNKIYRRCPSCRAIGSVLCSNCKVYRCVTFPDDTDGDELNF